MATWTNTADLYRRAFPLAKRERRQSMRKSYRRDIFLHHRHPASISL
jgi:hypothetical protein